MALTCSVIGHAYGDPTVEREREERGSEVVVTAREYETCQRCGATRVVSENKEVTAVDEEGVGDSIEEATSDDASPGDRMGEEPAAGGDVEPPDSDAGGDGVEDAEIMDAEAGDAVDQELASPSLAEAEAEGEPAAPEDEDAVVIETDSDDDGRAPGEWPTVREDEEEADWSPPADADEAPDVERSLGRTITVPEGEYHCQECGYATPVESSSLREGDFCPECHQGTLVHVDEN